MPANGNFPGVYVQELPSSVHPITGVATSITAFIGGAQRGPVNQPTTIHSFSDFVRQFGGLWSGSLLGYAVSDFFLNGGSQAIIVRVVQTTTAPAVAATATTPAAPATVAAVAAKCSLAGGGTGTGTTNTSLGLVAASPGLWGNNLSVAVDHAVRDTSNANLFNLTIFEKNPVTGSIVNTEKFVNLSVLHDDATFAPRVLQQGSQLVHVDAHTAGGTDWIIPPPGTTPADIAASNPTAFTNGVDGGPLTDNLFTTQGDPKQGIQALDNADLFNLLCIPPYNNTDVSSTVLSTAVTYCQSRRAVLLVDPPSSWTTKNLAQQGIATIITEIGSNLTSYAAIFFPRLLEADTLRNGQTREFVPCGAVAGVFATTDAQRGVWKAPAGTQASLAGVVGLSVPLTNDENGDLNPLGVNCLRIFPATGAVVWGARTLQGNDALTSQWKYIPVRRTALYIEESLYRGLQWVVFEPNDEPLWAQIRLNVGAFMHDLFRKGAFQGQTPKDAYLVKCDSETTTQTDINNGIVNILVGFAPLKPAEFVILQIEQLAGQIQV